MIDGQNYTNTMSWLLAGFSKRQLETVISVLDKINDTYSEDTQEEIVAKIGNINTQSLILELYLDRIEEAKELDKKADELWENLRNLLNQD